MGAAWFLGLAIGSITMPAFGAALLGIARNSNLHTTGIWVAEQFELAVLRILS
jgi:hypothetical protein